MVLFHAFWTDQHEECCCLSPESVYCCCYLHHMASSATARCTLHHGLHLPSQGVIFLGESRLRPFGIWLLASL